MTPSLLISDSAIKSTPKSLLRGNAVEHRPIHAPQPIYFFSSATTSIAGSYPWLPSSLLTPQKFYSLPIVLFILCRRNVSLRYEFFGVVTTGRTSGILNSGETLLRRFSDGFFPLLSNGSSINSSGLEMTIGVGLKEALLHGLYDLRAIR